jgi:hypothetical protein
LKLLEVGKMLLAVDGNAWWSCGICNMPGLMKEIVGRILRDARSPEIERKVMLTSV